jgi:hypothetical protein
VLSNGVYSIANSQLVDTFCKIQSEVSEAGNNRQKIIKKSGYKFSVEPIKVEKPKSTVKYVAPISNRLSSPVSFDLYPWESKNLVLLTISNDYDPLVVGRLLRSLDLAYEIYDQATSKFPKYTMNNSQWSRTINGKAIIAEIPSVGEQDSSKIISCGGNACTAVSTFGIEIRWQQLQATLWMLKHLDVYDHTLFYELGRTFWPQNTCAAKISLKESDPTITGFAVLMRYVVMKEIGLSFASDDTESGDTYYSRILGIENSFEENKDLNLVNVFQENRTINGFDRNAIWASLMTYLGNNHGGIEFYREFFSGCPLLLNPSSDLAALQNWKKLAEYASKKDLSSIFNARWRLPISD